MRPEHYTSHDLLQLYLVLKQDDYLHADLRTYDRQLYEHLSTLFRVDISPDGIKNTRYSALWLLFRNAVDSYTNTRYFGNSFLDASLILKRLEEFGEQGQSIEHAIIDVNQHVRDMKQSCLEILSTLFELLYAPLQITISPEQLLQRGFDVTQRPREEDYYHLL